MLGNRKGDDIFPVLLIVAPVVPTMVFWYCNPLRRNHSFPLLWIFLLISLGNGSASFSGLLLTILKPVILLTGSYFLLLHPFWILSKSVISFSRFPLAAFFASCSRFVEAVIRLFLVALIASFHISQQFLVKMASQGQERSYWVEQGACSAAVDAGYPAALSRHPKASSSP